MTNARLPHLADKTHYPNNKADWLRLVSRLGFSTYIPTFYAFNVAEWCASSKHILQKIVKQFSGLRIIIRSSREGEDSFTKGQAGQYLSVGPICSNQENSIAINDAISAVVNSYHRHTTTMSQATRDQVLIQVWVDNIVTVLGASSYSLVGVQPYFIVTTNNGITSNAITAGRVNVDRYFQHRQVATHHEFPKHVQQTIDLLKSLENCIGLNTLELELVFTTLGEIKLLQVRPITKSNPFVKHENTQDTYIAERRNLVEITTLKTEFKARTARPTCFSDVNDSDKSPHFFSLMSDWNPAELIGAHPRPLAISVFSHLITDAIWSSARHALGYQAVTPQPLIYPFAGRPYINVRLSCQSLIPAGISPFDANLYVDHVINQLHADTTLHDKVENSLYASCLDFESSHVKTLQEAGLLSASIQNWTDSLRTLTKELIVEHESLLAENTIDTTCIETEITIQSHPLHRSINTIRDRLAYPFAISARLAFIAHKLLSSALKTQLISADIYQRYLKNARTINPAPTQNNRSRLIRPGTFDIRVPAYTTTFHSYSSQEKDNVLTAELLLTEHEIIHLNRSLKELFSEVTALQFNAFVLGAIRAREAWKNTFSHCLGLWFEKLIEQGAAVHMNHDALSFLKLHDLKSVEDNNDISAIYSKILARNIKYENQQCVCLPTCIRSEANVFNFHEGQDRPNFQGTGLLQGVTQTIVGHQRNALKNSILLIESADPGYDWIFEHSPLALVTCYGGPHSHMSIRCAEKNIPCVLGCGSSAYAQLSAQTSLIIDFDGQHISFAGSY